MADQTLEKRSDGLAVEHQETLTSDSVGKTTIDVPVGIYADDISYGYSGIRGIIKSPYIFGAALLASMGGFSYGYGNIIPPNNPQSHHFLTFRRPRRHLPHPRNATIPIPIPRN
jgi:hypothetical protein